MKLKKIYIVYGVSGSGKSTIGKALSDHFKVPFFDADDFHPEANIKKMAQGSPLNDDDRKPWLESIAKQITIWHKNEGAVLACSALKQSYREILESVSSTYIEWIFLDGSFEVISNRLEERKNHFFRKELLTSQFETLEPPNKGISVSINQTVQKIIKEITTKLKAQKSQIGLIGLGVMGKSLASNVLSKGFSISVYNRQVADKEVDVAKRFVQDQPNANVLGFDDLASFVASIQRPRSIIIMVNAGKPIDMVIKAITPFLESGDILIDGGNSHYKETLKRSKYLETLGIHFIGAGISGGEEGALYGPSIMPGGSEIGYKQSKQFLEAIAARDKNDNPCCTYMGPEGSGHYVKMVHNGIEYAEMQLLAETYHLLRYHGDQSPDQISDIFNSWRANGADSYLLEISADILLKKEGDDFLIDKILDKAGQKGTGGWSTVAALDIGVPLSTISESVMARNISAKKLERVNASEIYQIRPTLINEDTSHFLITLEKAYKAASIVNHAIGFDLLSNASKEYNWNLNLSEIARLWTNGCIIRSELIENISSFFIRDNDTSLLLFPEIVSYMKDSITPLADIVSTGLKSAVPLPVFSAATNYFLSYITPNSSANMIQAQRDYFGAHTYQRVDKPLTEYFHTNWKKI